jgi:hypothetical protein
MRSPAFGVTGKAADVAELVRATAGAEASAHWCASLAKGEAATPACRGRQYDDQRQREGTGWDLAHQEIKSAVDSSRR